MQVLIIKMSALGDVLQTFPVSSYLRERFPEATIDWVVEKRFSSVVKANSQINTTHAINTKNLRKEISLFTRQLRQKKYDLVFDFQGNCKSGLITLLSRAKEKVGFSRKEIAEWPNLLVTTKKIHLPAPLPMKERYMSLVQTYFGDQIPYVPPIHLLARESSLNEDLGRTLSGRIFVAPFSKWGNKEIPKEFLIPLLRSLEEKGYRFCLLYQGKEEELKAREISLSLQNTLLVGDRPLSELQTLAQKGVGAICADSALLHLFSLINLPSFSLFGPSSSFVYAPKGVNMKTFQGSCPYHQKFEKRCDLLRTCKEAPCMKKLPFEQVEFKIREWLTSL